MVTVVNPVHPEKAYAPDDRVRSNLIMVQIMMMVPIEVTLVGIVTVVKFVQSLKV